MTAAAFSQDKQAETLAVKNLVYECGPSMPKATLLTRSLVRAEGKLAKFDVDSLYIRRDRKYFRTLYRDVLEIECRDKSVSNVRDPLTRPFGEWKEINQVYAATKIAVVLTDGTIVKGRSNTATDSHLVIFDTQTNTRRQKSRRA